MIKIIHVSDLHISHANNEKQDQLLTYIYGKYFCCPACDTYLLVTGDVVDDGLEAQYQAAKLLLGRFSGRLFVCPGNHDYALMGNFYEQSAIDRFNSTFDSLARPTGGYQKHLPTVDVVGDILMVGLNSCLKPGTFDFACGAIGHGQLAALNSILNEPKYENYWKVVYLHHKPAHLKWYNWPFFRLQDKEQFLSIAGPKADVIAFGHSESNSQSLIRAPGKINGTWMLDADDSVSQQAYFEMTFASDLSVLYSKVV